MRRAIRETCPSTCPVTCDGAKRRKVNGMANFCVLWGSLYYLKTSTETRTSQALRSHTVRIWQVWSKTYTNHGWYEVIDKGKDQETVFLETWQWKWNKHEAITLVFLFPVSKMFDLYLKRPREERDAITWLTTWPPSWNSHIKYESSKRKEFGQKIPGQGKGGLGSWLEMVCTVQGI